MTFHAIGELAIGEIDDAGTATPIYRAALADIGQIYLLEISPYRIGSSAGLGVPALPLSVGPICDVPTATGAGGLDDLQFSDAGYTTQDFGALPSTLFEGRVSQPLRLTWTLPVVPEADRRVVLEVANIEVINTDGQLDDFTGTYDIGGRAITVKLGLAGYNYEDFSPVYSGRADSWATTTIELTIAARDQGYQLAIPLQPSLYGGTGGADGTADLANKPKPICFGKCRNLTPVTIDPAFLVYQFHFRQAEAVDAVYDRAAALSFTADFPDYVSITGATLAIGEYATSLALGMIRVGGTPSGTLTADVRGDARGSYVDDTASILIRMLTDFALLADTSYDADAFATFQASVPGTIGWYETGAITIEDAFSAVVGHCGGNWGGTPEGLFTVGLLAAPDPGVVDYDLAFADILNIDIMDPPSGSSPPRFRQRVAYQKNWTLQSGQDVAPAVSDERRLTLGQPYNVSAVIDPQTSSDFSLAQDPPVLESLFDQEADAAGVAQLLIDLLSGQRTCVRVYLKTAGHLPRRASTITLTHPRVNSGQEWAARLIGQEIDAAARTVNLILWG